MRYRASLGFTHCSSSRVSAYAAGISAWVSGSPLARLIAAVTVAKMRSLDGTRSGLLRCGACKYFPPASAASSSAHGPVCHPSTDMDSRLLAAHNRPRRQVSGSSHRKNIPPCNAALAALLSSCQPALHKAWTKAEAVCSLALKKSMMGLQTASDSPTGDISRMRV